MLNAHIIFNIVINAGDCEVFLIKQATVQKFAVTYDLKYDIKFESFIVRDHNT